MRILCLFRLRFFRVLTIRTYLYLLLFVSMGGRTTFSTEYNQTMASNDPFRLISRVVNLSQATSRGDEVRPRVTNAINAAKTWRSLRICRIRRFVGYAEIPSVLCGRPGVFHFPYVCRPPRGERPGIHTRVIAWSCLIKQIQGNLQTESRIHANSLRAVADISTRAFAQMRFHRSPL